jgi:hypothetical protein
MFFGDVCFVDGVTAATHLEQPALSVISRVDFTTFSPTTSPNVHVFSGPGCSFDAKYATHWKLDFYDSKLSDMTLEMLICKNEGHPYFLELLECGLNGPALLSITINGSLAVKGYRVYGSEVGVNMCWDRFEISRLLKNGWNTITLSLHPETSNGLALSQLLITTR